jgi:hypothetical protein
MGINNMFHTRINAGRLSPRVFWLIFGAISQARRIPPFYRTPSMWLRLTRPGLWRRTGHWPWWLLRLYQQAAVGGRLRYRQKVWPVWAVRLAPPGISRWFGRRLARQMPLVAPAVIGPFPQPPAPHAPAGAARRCSAA